MDFSAVLIPNVLRFPGNAFASLMYSQGFVAISSPGAVAATNYPTGGVETNSPAGSVGVRSNNSSAGLS